jgi:hypothetical protein
MSKQILKQPLITSNYFQASQSVVIGNPGGDYTSANGIVFSDGTIQTTAGTSPASTGSFATTGSNIFRGNQTVTGSLFTTGSNTLIGSTTLTGSLNVSGSTTQVGNNTLLGNTILSGSIIISGALGTNNPTVRIYGDTEHNGYIRFDPVSTNIDPSISASYIYVSGSTNDLYFTQNGQGYGNTTRLRWLEGNLYTGLLHGGRITSASSTTFNISSGSGIVVNLNASLGVDPYPTIKFVNWGTLTNQTLTYRTSSIQTFLGIDSDGNIIQQTVPWVNGEYNTSISLGTVLHQNQSTINGSISYPNVAYGYKQRTYDFIKAFGPLKLSGYPIIPSSSLGLTVGSGIAFADGRNYQNDPNNPSYITDPGTTVSKIFRYYQSGSSFVQDTNGGLGYTVIDPTNYNPNNSGSLAAVPGGFYSVQRVFWYPNSTTKGIVVYYGTATYNSIDNARTNYLFEDFNEVENTKQNAVYLGAIIIKSNGSFTTANDYQIIASGLFRSSVGGGGGGGGGTTSPGGNSGEIQYNNGGTFGGVPNLTWDGSTLTASGSFTGNLIGTSSWSTNALTASFAPDYVLTSSTGSMLAPYVLTSQTSSMTVLSSSFATTASFIDTVNLTTLPTVVAFTAPVASVTSGGTAAETTLTTLTVPAGIFKSGDQILLTLWGSRTTGASSGVNSTLTTRISSISGSTVIATVTGNRHHNYTLTGRCLSDTSIIWWQNSPTTAAATTTVPSLASSGFTLNFSVTRDLNTSEFTLYNAICRKYN